VKKTVKLQGKNIYLSRYSLADIDTLNKAASHKDISRWMSEFPHPYNLKHAREFISRSRKKWLDKTEYNFSIKLKGSDELIGGVSLVNVNNKQKMAELGYWLDKVHWGQGYISEAVKTILEYAFNQVKLHRVYARVFTPNLASARVLEKSGFRFEGHEIKSILKNGRWYDMYRFAILERDFKRKNKK